MSNLAQARLLALGPHALKIEPSAASGGLVKLSSYIVSIPGEPNLEDMDLETIEKMFHRGSEMSMRDIMPDREQRESLLHQTTIFIIKALIDNGPTTFKQYEDHPDFQFKPRRPLPDFYRTKIIYVTSVTGRHTTDLYASLLRETYGTKLNMDGKMLEKRAIPSLNPDATNDAIRQAQDVIRRQKKPWTTEQYAMMSLVLGPGLGDVFKHFVQETVGEAGGSRRSIAEHLEMTNETHFMDAKPKNFHALVSALETILDASFFDCWRVHCGFKNLEDFAKSNPSPKQLLAIAKKIAIENVKRIVPKDPSFEDDNQYSGEHSDDEGPNEDQVYRNQRIMLASLLRIFILRQAISDADVGRVEDILGSVLVTFYGMGKDALAKELMHFTQGIKIIWPKPFGDIMRDCLVMNLFHASSNSQAADVTTAYLSSYAKYYIHENEMDDLYRKPGSMEDAILLIDDLDFRLSGM